MRHDPVHAARRYGCAWSSIWRRRHWRTRVDLRSCRTSDCLRGSHVHRSASAARRSAQRPRATAAGARCSTARPGSAPDGNPQRGRPGPAELDDEPAADHRARTGRFRFVVGRVSRHDRGVGEIGSQSRTRAQLSTVGSFSQVGRRFQIGPGWRSAQRRAAPSPSLLAAGPSPARPLSSSTGRDVQPLGQLVQVLLASMSIDATRRVGLRVAGAPFRLLVRRPALLLLLPVVADLLEGVLQRGERGPVRASPSP